MKIQRFQSEWIVLLVVLELRLKYYYKISLKFFQLFYFPLCDIRSQNNIAKGGTLGNQIKTSRILYVQCSCPWFEFPRFCISEKHTCRFVSLLLLICICYKHTQLQGWARQTIHVCRLISQLMYNWSLWNFLCAMLIVIIENYQNFKLLFLFFSDMIFH